MNGLLCRLGWHRVTVYDHPILASYGRHLGCSFCGKLLTVERLTPEEEDE